VNLTRHQVDLCRFALQQLVELSPIVRGLSVSFEIRNLLQLLRDMLLACDHESESDSGGEELVSKGLVGTTTAADLLECTPQRVRQIRCDLGGQTCPCGAGWVFDRQTVIEYAQRKASR
jgi:hypothetical protein